MVKLFGTTVRETLTALTSSIHAGEGQSTVTNEDKTKVIGRIVISVLLLFLATYLFTSGNKETGATIVGALVGYWVK